FSKCCKIATGLTDVREELERLSVQVIQCDVRSTRRSLNHFGQSIESRRSLHRRNLLLRLLDMLENSFARAVSVVRDAFATKVVRKFVQSFDLFNCMSLRSVHRLRDRTVNVLLNRGLHT